MIVSSTTCFARRAVRFIGCLLFSLLSCSFAHALQLEPGDHVCYIGNTLADRMQHDGWLETYIHALYPEYRLTFRNLGYPGDEVDLRPREENFGNPDQWLAKCQADVVFCFFGHNEALKGEAGLDQFREDLSGMIRHMQGQQYNGKSAPRLVVFSPIAHEDLHSPNLPDGAENNRSLALYTDAMRDICAAADVSFVDLFTPTVRLYDEASEPLTMNGIHLLPEGNRQLSRVIFQQLFPDASLDQLGDISRLRQAVLEKNYYWFSRYRVVDGYNVFGGRSKLEWFGQSNADVMRREMEILDILTANRDQRVWAVARGEDLVVRDDNLPEELLVPTNKPGDLAGGAWPYLGGEEAIAKMQLADGMSVNLFASEERFPRLINPVQMAVDTDSRLWVSVWPSYPHWNPVQPRRDALLILPDEDRDGVADECRVFADELNSITGFEFWGGGVLVAAPPEIWFLKDTDGDDKADVKVRVLQGISSADTHHSANSVLMGPDGWLYWSRGIFNVANFETPTKTFRSGESGVYRFNPRTFEVEFHFPIGPNPHGDVFDRWGYQFANDGTGGTGSYVNIGKGIGNKQWFQQRVRPVAATGILSSSHFPPHNNENFLIANVIGFLGVLQHEVNYDGADITATEIEPILVSSDENFRPSDLEIGGDGALYIADWHNVLIGHMQHNMRDPNRDHEHGRIYRVTYPERELLTPPKMKGKSIREVCEHFFAAANSTRYRARLELSGRDTADVVAQVTAFADTLDPAVASAERDEAQVLLECLWVFEEHRVPNRELLTKVLRAEEPRVRAAALRTLGHWNGRIEGWESLLIAGARDESALVRAETLKAAAEFSGLTAAEVVFEVATRPLDPELSTVLDYARGAIHVDRVVDEAIRSGAELSPAARTYVLENAAVANLLKLPRTADVCEAIVRRSEATVEQLQTALGSWAALQNRSVLDVLFEQLERVDADPQAGNPVALGSLLARQSAADLQAVHDRIEELATASRSDQLRQVGYAVWIESGGADDAFLAATKSKRRLRDYLGAVPLLSPEIRATLYGKIEPLVLDLPPGLEGEAATPELVTPGLQVDFFYPSPSDVALETLASMQPVASGVAPEITLDVPQRQQADQFALRFTGRIQIPRSGRYAFFLTSDDGSRLYIDDELVIDNDGLHGMVERRGSVDLPAGSHRIVVTYFDNGGNDGLRIAWRGPGLARRRIATEFLSVGGSDSLHDLAIRALSTIPGHEAEKFLTLSRAVKSGRSRPAAVSVLSGIGSENWAPGEVGALVDNLAGYLSSMPAQYRTSGPATEALQLARKMAERLPGEQAGKALERLDNLDVHVIAIGTVPHRMIFDKERIAVQAGKPVEFRFSNTDAMPHNLAIVKPGALEEVGELAEATGREPDALQRGYIPRSEKILFASRLLQPGESQAIVFEAPSEPGVYPYVCTYPGHWRRMYGALYVVANLQQYEADPDSYLASHELPIRDELLKFSSRNHEWTYDELIGDLRTLPPGRNFEVGKQLFKVATCSGCHKLDDEGNVFGPDLAQLDEKKHTTDHILRSIVEPSRDIDEKYLSYAFLLDSGKVLTGMIVEETQDTVLVVIDPLAKDKPTEISKSSIEEKIKSDVSLMPLGLLNKLTHEEILDLVAFVYTGGDRNHAMYADHDHH